MNASPPRTPAPRSFLFLQGLASPFFARLGAALAEAGHKVEKIAFNGGDSMFWPRDRVRDYAGTAGDWPAALAAILAEGVTDLVLFGDGRPAHANAIAVARGLGITSWVFEEGYLRPGTIALERGGVNAASPLPRDADAIRALAQGLPPVPREDGPGEPFPRRAALDIAYNMRVLAGRRGFPHWRTHRGWNVFHEYLGWARRGALRALREHSSTRAMDRLLAEAEAHPFILFPLQLEGDFQVRRHSDLATVRHGVERAIASLAQHAPAAMRLVVKGHPLDNGLVPWRRIIRRVAAQHGAAGRVVFLDEVAYGPLLAASTGVLTINSTAGLQALREGKPVALMGRALYGLPGLVWQGPLDGFWAAPAPPDMALVDALRRVLMAHALIPGGFFSEPALAQAVNGAAARLLAPVHHAP
ncbi:MAG: capsular biosynthesis protein [Pseudomonadota bacterium]